MTVFLISHCHPDYLKIVVSNQRLMMFASPSTKADDEQLFFGDISIFIQKFRVGRSQPGSILAGSELTHGSQCLDNHKYKECCEGERVNDSKHILNKEVVDFNVTAAKGLAAFFSNSQYKHHVNQYPLFWYFRHSYAYFL